MDRLIRGAVVDAFGKPDGGVLPDSPWLDFLGELGQLPREGAGPGRPVLLFTTNYDTGIAYLEEGLADRGIAVASGFPKTTTKGVWSRQRVEKAVGAAAGGPGDTRVAHLQLHGAVYWQRNKQDGMIEHLDENNLPLPDPEAKGLIWPAVHKLPFTDPFWCHHEYLVSALQEAPGVAFIGYGFRDEAVMALVRLALCRRDEPPPIAILDENREAVARAIHPRFGCIRNLPEGAHVKSAFVKKAIPEVLAAMGFGSRVRERKPPAGHAGTAGNSEAPTSGGATGASAPAGDGTPSSAPRPMPAPPASAVSDDLQRHATDLQTDITRHLSTCKVYRRDLGTWQHLRGGEWSVARAEATSPGSGDRKFLVSPQEYAAFFVQATLQDLSGGGNWYGIGVFYRGPEPFLGFQVQRPTIKVKWRFVHKPDYVPPPGKAVAAGKPLNFYLVYDGALLRFAAVQPGVGLLSYYETAELPGRSGRIALVVREKQYTARFSNVCVGELP